MPALSCECLEVIEKEGLVHYLREYVDGIICLGCTLGATHNEIYTVMGQCLGAASLGIFVKGVVGEELLSSGQRAVLSATVHMIEEAKEAGYSPRAFRESIDEALTNG